MSVREAPKFRHRCPSCVHLGPSQDRLHDLYVCTSHTTMDLLLARRGHQLRQSDDAHHDLDFEDRVDCVMASDVAPERLVGYRGGPPSERQLRLADAWNLAHERGLLRYLNKPSEPVADYPL